MCFHLIQDVSGTLPGKEKWEICNNLVKRNMQLAIDVFLSERDPVDEDVKFALNNTFFHIVNVVKKKLHFVENDKFFYNYLLLKVKYLLSEIFYTRNSFL